MLFFFVYTESDSRLLTLSYEGAFQLSRPLASSDLCAFARPLSEEPAPPQDAPACPDPRGVTPLESALPNLKDLKFFRIRTYKKGGGGG